jgi:hypothetical protein
VKSMSYLEARNTVMGKPGEANAADAGLPRDE